MSEMNYEHMGRLIYRTHRAGGNEADIHKWMADDLGVVLCTCADRAKLDLYSAFLEKYAEEDAFQENLAQLLESLAKRRV
jgi:hypothetical protein